MTEPDQVPRLNAFRQAHPEITISAARHAAYWQAVIPEEHGETTIVRYTLRELLDKLDEIT